jgi:hypothetical protein
MKSVTNDFAAYLAQSGRNRAFCLKLTRSDGVVIRGTNWDENIEYPPGSGEIYYHTSGGALGDIEATAALNVDNAEIQCNFAAITASDLRAGLYDYASYELFLLNPNNLTAGRYRMHTGNLGQVTISRNAFKAELRGRLQTLQQSIGRLISPTCPYQTYDGECGLDAEDWTVSGTLDSVSSDQLTFKDSARTELGPSGGIAITAITNADPCVITTASAHGFYAGQTVYLSAIVGPAALNGPVSVRDPSGSSFEIAIDTTDTAAYPAYVGSGIATPMGAESGYFDYGVMTITSGANAGVEREVKAYVAGTWTIHEAFPHAVTGSETYSMTAGDDKTATTCRVKFDNLLNFGGMPFVPGPDQLIQIGRQK